MDGPPGLRPGPLRRLDPRGFGEGRQGPRGEDRRARRREVGRGEGRPRRPSADDAEFLRRACLDLNGKIPKVSEVRQFLDDTDPDKRAKVVDRLLSGPTYVNHSVNVWRSLLLPEANSDIQIRFLRPDFDDWLRQQFRDGVGYDKVVRELVTAKLGENARQGFNPYNSQGTAEPAGLLHGQGGQAREPRGQHRPALPGRADRVRPVPRPPLRTLEARAVLGLRRLLRRRPEAGPRRPVRPDPRAPRPPRAGDPRHRPRRAGRLPRRRASRSGSSRSAPASPWPTG